MTVLSVRLRAGRDRYTGRLGYAAFVALEGRSEVRVRWRDVARAAAFRCDDHGAHPRPTCPHELAAHAAWRDQEQGESR